MNDDPQVGELFLFKGEDIAGTSWCEKPDIGILISYDEVTREGVMYWLRHPDPEQGHLNSFDFNYIQKEKFERFINK